MNFNVSGNMTVMNAQMGEANTMTVNCPGKVDLLQEGEWQEMKDFLDRRLAELPEKGDSARLVKESLRLVESKDEGGLREFFLRNRDSFINNVCSNVISSGLMLILSKLSF